MWRVRPSLVAYVLFILACLLPGWRLRDRVAAEVQMRLPDWTVPWDLSEGDYRWRGLGRDGSEYLLSLTSKTIDPAVRCRAWGRLCFDGSLAVWEVRILALEDPDPRVVEAAWRFPRGLDWSPIAVCLDRVTDDRVAVLLGHVWNPGASSSNVNASPVFLYTLWTERPERAERILCALLSRTDDYALAKELTSGRYFFGCFLQEYDSLSPEIHARRMRTLRAGLSNPCEEICGLCLQRLAEEEAREAHQ